MTADSKARKSIWKIQLEEPEDNSNLIEISKKLLEISFKPLTRPNLGLHGRTEKELRWLLRVFTASSMSSFRDMLKTYLVLRANELEAGSFLVLRNMFEMLAGAHYVHQKFSEYLDANDTENAWKLLDTVVTASKFARLVHNPPPPVSDPLKIGLLINSLDSFDSTSRKGWAYEHYRFLSEFSHPDAMTYLHYHRIDAQTLQTTFFTEPEPDKGFLRTTVGWMVVMAGQIYGRLFHKAQFRTQERLLAHAMSTFRESETKFAKSSSIRAC